MPNKIVTIKRTHYLNDGVMGVLDIDNVPICVTIELPWRNNAPYISCIPEGERKMVLIDSPKFGVCYEVITENRSKILIHWGNHVVDLPGDPKDSEGCIIVGEQFINYKSAMGVGMSKVAFSEFMNLMNGDKEAILIILNKS